jgi:hypothetical protein
MWKAKTASSRQWMRLGGRNPSISLLKRPQQQTRQKTMGAKPPTTGRRRRRNEPEEAYPFGLNPVDYSKPPPITPSPPPPPPKRGLSRYAFPASLLVTLGLTVYIYINNKNDSYEYWRTMQSGGAILDEDDDDEDEA